jgi:phospholipase/lecithinase/hemolysin
MKQVSLKTALFGLVSMCLSAAASAAGFNQFIAFGDSTIDTGYPTPV